MKIVNFLPHLVTGKINTNYPFNSSSNNKMSFGSVGINLMIINFVKIVNLITIAPFFFFLKVLNHKILQNGYLNLDFQLFTGNKKIDHCVIETFSNIEIIIPIQRIADLRTNFSLKLSQ